MTDDDPMYEIPGSRLRELNRATKKLAALEAAGVDNWEGYDEAMASLDEESQ